MKSFINNLVKQLNLEYYRIKIIDRNLLHYQDGIQQDHPQI